MPDLAGNWKPFILKQKRSVWQKLKNLSFLPSKQLWGKLFYMSGNSTPNSSKLTKIVLLRPFLIFVLDHESWSITPEQFRTVSKDYFYWISGAPLWRMFFLINKLLICKWWCVEGKCIINLVLGSLVFICLFYLLHNWQSDSIHVYCVLT